MDILEMKQKRAGLVQQARALIDKADSEKRELTAEEETSYDKYMEDVDKIGSTIEKEERLKKVESELKKLDADPVKPDPKDDTRNKSVFATEEYRTAFESYLLKGGRGINPAEAKVLSVTRASRALQVDQDIYGGYLVAPEMFVTQLIKDLDNENGSSYCCAGNSNLE